MNLAKVKSGKVTDVIVADSVLTGYKEIPEGVNAGIGWSFANNTYTDNRPVETNRKTIYSRFSFKRLFTPSEWSGIKTSADAIIEGFVEDFKVADYINLDHKDLISALAYMEAEGLLASGRGNEIRGV